MLGRVRMDELKNKMAYYRQEAKEGRYHNPYDVENELNEILMKMGIKKASVGIKLEDEIFEIAELFWSM